MLKQRQCTHTHSHNTHRYQEVADFTNTHTQTFTYRYQDDADFTNTYRALGSIASSSSECSAATVSVVWAM